MQNLIDQALMTEEYAGIQKEPPHLVTPFVSTSVLFFGRGDRI